jgi:hypothetical protein
MRDAKATAPANVSNFVCYRMGATMVDSPPRATIERRHLTEARLKSSVSIGRVSKLTRGDGGHHFPFFIPENSWLTLLVLISISSSSPVFFCHLHCSHFSLCRGSGWRFPFSCEECGANNGFDVSIRGFANT